MVDTVAPHLGDTSSVELTEVLGVKVEVSRPSDLRETSRVQALAEAAPW